MTIEVLKVGKLPCQRRYYFMCMNCKTEFTAIGNDGRLVHAGRFENDCRYVATSVGVPCPVCTKEVYSSKECSLHKVEDMYSLTGS